MKRIAALMVGVLLVGQGCSFLAGTTQTLTVTCDDADADIFIDGQKVGKGTVTPRVRRDSAHIVMARNGSRTQTVAIGTRLSTPGLLDIIGGFLWIIPFVGLVTPGAHQLDIEAVGLTFNP